MIINIFIYFLMFLSLLIPWSTWFPSMTRKGRCFIDNLVHLYQVNKVKYQKMNTVYQGQELLAFFPEMEKIIIQGKSQLKIIFPEYKFYTTILTDLLSAHRRFGIPLKQSIVEIRKELINDLKFEKKINSQKLGGYFQFAMIIGCTWAFVYISSSLIVMPVKTQILIFMLSLQLLAVLVFRHIFALIKIKRFKKFNSALGELYLANNLFKIQLPMQSVLEQSQVLNGSFATEKCFVLLFLRLESLIQRLKTEGIGLKDEFEEIIAMTWSLQEEEFTHFLKNLEFLKFTIMVVFLLPSYFLYLWAIFQFFMEQ